MNKFLSKIIKFFGGAEDVMFPHFACPFCGIETPDGVVCPNCNTSKITGDICPVCGEPVGSPNALCLECKSSKRKFTASRSVMVYNRVTSEAIVKLKFKGAKYLAKDFAKLLADKFNSLDWSVDLVCAVPSHITTIRKRGYNQAEEIAKEFCNLTGLKYVQLLTKVKNTPHQASLGRQARLNNLKGCMQVQDKWACKGRNILVIDDVITTGSTLETCAQELKRAKAKNVYCLTVAKTPNIKIEEND